MDFSPGVVIVLSAAAVAGITASIIAYWRYRQKVPKDGP